ncbi:LD-carboxypeptidase [Croceicoccus naphthovorans]|uniref:Carboxypeptidase n=1 Tax=Croceicoccus naphthovorans TaxID=1348774 RepID=A0A0G3XM92_9SPHN|nr:LD-carboxypeptidase [Croceicoccus naphthovorans]AKM11789.1 carboxypeptidase [Croceicoccus naphthovorans]MBB3988688.1 muramoyltetrapeptide carboxypeptidase [Croceicoccus naphthovorans]
MVRVAICAPSATLPRELVAPVEHVASHYPGIELIFHDQCFAEAGHFAGTDEQRLEALLECANDPTIDAVWFARGGYGSNRICEPALTYLSRAADDKIFLGSSDGGYLLGSLYKAGIGHPVHAPMPLDIKREGGGDAIARVLAWLSGHPETLEPHLDNRPTVAFNLTTLAMLAGTRLMPDLTGHVVMVEEVSEYLYSVDRLMFHTTSVLRHMNVAGLRLGRVSDVPENDRPFGSDATAIAQDWCARMAIPFLGPADIGHDFANRIVPFGSADRNLPLGVVRAPAAA